VSDGFSDREAARMLTDVGSRFDPDVSVGVPISERGSDEIA
jgi:hypothetical protein